jgi:hypothetical protein
MLEAIRFSETSVVIRATRSHIPEESIHNNVIVLIVYGLYMSVFQAVEHVYFATVSIEAEREPWNGTANKSVESPKAADIENDMRF